MAYPSSRSRLRYILAMSGLETIAALIGIADVSFRSISALYTAVQDIRSAPKEIESLAAELKVLRHCLLQLRFLEKADSKTRAATRDFGLPTAIKLCGVACDKLHRNLPDCKSNRSPNLRSRVRFYFSKTEIRNVLENINCAKQTTILTVVTTQLFLQLQSQTSPQKKLDLINKYEEEVKAMESRNKTEKGNHKMSRRSSSKARAARFPLSEDDRPVDKELVPYSAPNVGSNAPSADTNPQGHTRYAYERVSQTLNALRDDYKVNFKGNIDAKGEGSNWGAPADPKKNQDIVVDFKGKIATTAESKNLTFGIYSPR
ncbi:hypothetical protein J1614_005563 [Plenodomus biglobosus]|nr:hypothetical protein J1614_005563 [Plenodomus biglobosus]